MCIKEQWSTSFEPSNVLPVFGEIYTVVDMGYVWGIKVYDLEEIPTHVFKADHFAPLSDIDETETEVYKNLQTQTV